MQNRPGTKRHGAFDGIFQFPDIAWPIMGHQPPHGVLRNCADWALWIAEFFQERINQQRDITFALTQWRQLDLDDVEAEKEILAEGAGANGGFQIAVGGSDRPHIDPHAISRAHRPDFALLKRAQQLGLHIHREIANFVEENSSAVTGFQQAGVSVLRPVKAPFTWPNSSDSMRVGTKVEQSTGTNGLLFLTPRKWIDRATSSLPVPLSPSTKTGCRCWLTFSIILYTRCIFGEIPINPPKPGRVRSCSRRTRFS